MSNKVTIEIDSIYYQLLKDYYDIAILHHQKKQEIRESFNNEYGFSDLEICERVYQGALDDFFRVLQKTSVMLVDSEPAPEESESSIDNISSNDASSNDTSSNDVVNADEDELPFPMDDASYALGLDQRVVVLTLSDEDCDRLTEMCGVRKVSVDVMLQNFVRDLVKSKFSNRPEDIINANLWFDNCWFRHSYQPLLGWLVSNGYDPYDDCICYIESIEHGESELLDYEVNPAGFNPEEMEYLKEDIKDWKEHICKIRRQFLSAFADANWSCEFEELEKWYKNRELFKDGTVTFRGRVLNINR